MSRADHHRGTGAARTFARNEDGTVLVELAIVLPVFLLLFFGLLDFGRFGAEYVMAEKAMQRAARIAVVRPPACPGVALIHTRGAVPVGTVPPRFGTKCSAGATICANPGIVTCTGSAADPTVAEIWTQISAMMPTGSTPANLRLRYEYDQSLGFLGGPYTPVVTVEIQNLNFQFATPLSALATLARATPGSAPGATLPFPTMSVSLPAEDLASGNAG